MADGVATMTSSKTKMAESGGAVSMSVNTSGGGKQEVLTREEKAEQAAQNIFGKDYFSKSGIIMSEYEANFLENARMDQLREDDKRAQLNKKASIQLNTRAISRGSEKFVTQGSSTEINLYDTTFESNRLNNLDLAEILKKTPRRHNQMASCGHGLTCLLSCQEGQPYNTLGTVLTNTSELIKSCLLDDVRYRMEKHEKLQQRGGTPGIRRLNPRGRPASRRDKRSGGLKEDPGDQEAKADAAVTPGTPRVTILDSTGDGSVPALDTAEALPRASIARGSIARGSIASTAARRASMAGGPDSSNASAGLGLIRDQLSLSGKMRTDVSGTLDLCTALDFRNRQTSQPPSCEASVATEGSPRPPNKAAEQAGGRPRQITANTPWRQISVKTRPQTIHTIAENQVLMQQKIAQNQAALTCAAGGSVASSPRPEPTDRTLKARRGTCATGAQLAGKKQLGWSKVVRVGKVASQPPRSSVPAKVMQEAEPVETAQEGLRFLTILNKLLCALYNLKKASLKAAEPLTESALKELLNSDIELDDEGRPRPKHVPKPQPQPARLAMSVLYTRRQSVYTYNLPSKLADGTVDSRKSKLCKTSAYRNKAILSNTAKNYKAVKDQPKVATWEDLLIVDVNTGEIPHPQSPNKSQKRRVDQAGREGQSSRDGESGSGTAAPTKQQPLWLREERHGSEFMAQAQASANDPLGALLDTGSLKAYKNDKVAKMRKEFEQTKAGLSKELNLELEYRKQQQALLVRNKLLSLELGPIASVSLEKMRRDANKKVKDEQLLTPLQTPVWFSKIERKYEAYTLCRSALVDLARFQRYPVSDMCDTSKLSSCHDIQKNKQSFLRALDKLCLLMGSLPMNEVLMCQYPLAFQFIIREILGFPDSIYQNWLRLRTCGRLQNYISMANGDIA